MIQMKLKILPSFLDINYLKINKYLMSYSSSLRNLETLDKMTYGTSLALSGLIHIFMLNYYHLVV